MSTNAPAAERPDTRRSDTERAVAIAESMAPLALGTLAPFLDGGATAAVGALYGTAAAVTIANYMDYLPKPLIDQLPASDILEAHKTTLLMSAVASGMSFSLGAFAGAENTAALLAGWLDPLSVPGIVSLAWWSAVALVPYKLRRILARKPRPNHHTAAQTVPANAPAVPPNDPDDVTGRWYRHISHPEHGTNRRQDLLDCIIRPNYWTGRITAPAGVAVNITRETVSSVYQVDPAWVKMRPGAHAGERLIRVYRNAPAELDPTTLQGAYAKYAARPGGLMAKTHLEEAQKDPNTGGEVAYVVADEDLDVLPTPPLFELAGAMRTSPLLISYEAISDNPRKAIIRTMKENPLEQGYDFPGLDALKATPGGRVPIGRVVSGHPWMLPMFDPVLGALHLVIAGTTGSGKGGAAQIVCLAYHANNAAILYADPKGASNPAIPKMAAYSGLQAYGALGALRISHAVLLHRKEEAAKYELKNFQPSASRPWCATVLDEAAQLLAPNVPNRKEAIHITKSGASLGRSLGMPWTLINQTVNLNQNGGEQAIRANLINGGSWLILRTDSGQTDLADLPDGFEGIDPSKIPTVWKSGSDSLIYDPEMPEDDPRRTFGLGFLGTAGGRPGMGRTFTLEDATPHIRPEQVAIPEDFPDWSDARLEEIANTPVAGFDENGNGDGDEPSGPKYTPGVDLPRRELSADDKILQALRDSADPLHLEALAGEDIDPDEYEITYLDKAALIAQTGLKETTLSNALSRLAKTDKMHRQDGTRGMYGIGPAPATDPAGE